MKFFLAFLAAVCCSCAVSKVQVYFSDQDANTEDIIVNYIAQARDTVLVQAYGFNSEKIYEVLDSLHKNNVEVEVLLDKSNETNAWSKLKSLKHEKIKTMIDYKPAIAHNKIIIIDNRIVITGSYNWTEHSKRNAENVIIITDPEIAQQYVDHWYERETVSRKPRKR